MADYTLSRIVLRHVRQLLIWWPLPCPGPEHRRQGVQPCPGIGAQEQIAGGPAQQDGDPGLDPMMRPVKQQMTPLAQGLQVPGSVVARVVVEMCGGQVDRRGPDPAVVHDIRPRRRLTAAIAPRVVRRVEPAAVRQAAHGPPPMRSGTVSAAADTVRPRCLEPDAGADLRPVQWVEPAARMEGHGQGQLWRQALGPACPTPDSAPRSKKAWAPPT